MKEMGIKSQWVKPWTITTIASDFNNELHERFTPDRPNAVWCSDITYIWTLSQTLVVSCMINTINKAKVRRNTELPLIIHSDKESPYVS